MKVLKGSYSNNKNIYGFDVETKQEQKDGYIEQKFYMGSIVGKNMKRVFFDAKVFADFLCSRQFRNSLLYATNLEFDFRHIFQGNNKHFKDMFFVDKNGLIYVKYKPDARHKIEFIDTWNYTSKIALKNMGEMLGIEKLPQPKCFKREARTYDEKQEIIDYNVRDSMITYKFAEKMRDFCDMLGCKLKITIASVGLDNWRRNYQEQDIFQESRSNLNLHYNAFHGGRTEVFKRGYFDKIYYYDFNSAYPYSCFMGYDGKGSYPLPSSAKYSKSLSINDIKNYEGITEVTAECPYMYATLLGITTDEGKYVFPYGKIRGWFSNVELRKAIELGYKIKEIKQGIFYTRNFIPFRKCIKDLYKMRKKYKDDDNYIMQNMVKVLMNGGIFGKFAQKINDKVTMINNDEIFCDKKGIPYIIKNNKIIFLNDYLIRGDFIFNKVKNPDRIPIFIHPILSTYTTSIARLLLFDKLHSIEDYLIYSDTDSVVSMKKSFPSSAELGKLKLEYEGNEAVFIKPKSYYIKDISGKYHFKFKGIGKYIDSKKSFDDAINNKIANTQRFTKIKESAVRKLPFSSIIDVNKRINLEDNKRDWKEKFNIRKMQNSKPLLWS